MLTNEGKKVLLESLDANTKTPLSLQFTLEGARTDEAKVSLWLCSPDGALLRLHDSDFALLSKGDSLTCFLPDKVAPSDFGEIVST